MIIKRVGFDYQTAFSGTVWCLPVVGGFPPAFGKTRVRLPQFFLTSGLVVGVVRRPEGAWLSASMGRGSSFVVVS